jgi:hypothetical protein
MTQQQKAILVVHVEVDEADADELDKWYEQEHRPDKLALPGYTSLRRFRAFDGEDGEAHFLAIYELDYPEAAQGNTMHVTDWSKAVMEKWKKWNRRIWVELPSA